MGKEIESFKVKSQSPGVHDVVWNGKNSSGEEVASGIYLYVLRTYNNNGIIKEYSSSSKMILLK